jgi:hypothetical protein
MERRRLAGMKPASLSHHRKIKKLSQRHRGTDGKVTGWMEWMALIVPTVDQQMTLCDQLEMPPPPCLRAFVRKKKNPLV